MPISLVVAAVLTFVLSLALLLLLLGGDSPVAARLTEIAAEPSIQSPLTGERKGPQIASLHTSCNGSGHCGRCSGWQTMAKLHAG